MAANLQSTSSVFEKYDYLGLFLLLSSYTAWQIYRLPTDHLAYEGAINIQTSRLLGQGFEAYTQIISLESPLFVWFLGQLGVLGLSLTAYQAMFLGFGMLTILGTLILAQHLAGKLAAWGACLLLLTSVTFLLNMTHVIAMMPATCLSTFVLLSWLRYTRTKQLWWILGAGGFIGLALQISPIVLPMGLWLIGWLLVKGIPYQGRSDVLPLCLYLLGCVLTFGLGLIVMGVDFGFDHYLKNIIAQATLRQNLPLVLDQNFGEIGLFLFFHLPISICFTFGLSAIYKQADHPLWLMTLWAGGSMVYLMSQVVSLQAQLIMLLPPLAIVGGYGLAEGLRWMSERVPDSAGVTETNIARPLWHLGLGISGLGLYLIFAWQLAQSFLYQDIGSDRNWRQFQQRPEMVTFIRENTQPDDCVVADDPTLTILADRLPSPMLSNISPALVLSGLLTEIDIQMEVQEANCTLVLLYRRSYHRHLMEFRHWVREYYPDSTSFQDARFYFDRSHHQ